MQLQGLGKYVETSQRLSTKQVSSSFRLLGPPETAVKWTAKAATTTATGYPCALTDDKPCFLAVFVARLKDATRHLLKVMFLLALDRRLGE